MVPRLALYGLTSATLATGVVYSALKTRENFYSASVAVGRSTGSLMVLANFALFNTICLGIGLKKLFFGQLRAIEYEHLFERLWIFLTESLLALTIFRDDFSAPFAVMYSVLLFLKCFHWITADRVDYMDQIPPPGPPKTFHFRIASIIVLLASVDLLLTSYSIETILTEGVSAMVLFASEFTILQASILGTSARYVVNLIDLRRARGRADAPSWEEKSMYLFYIDLAVDFIKLLTYLTFFAVILLHYGLPLHILRDVYMTMRSFVSRCGDLIRYRRATRDMDALYPDATEEEMERLGDRTCIICREEMIPRGSLRATQPDPAAEGVEGADAGAGGPNETPKKLTCGHVFHFHCLRSWLERQQSCPTCRRDVLHAPAPTPARAAAQRAANIAQPPPPAPGAAPQPPQQAPPRATDTPAMQQAYNEYFSAPRFGLDNPVPENAGGPSPSGAAAAGAPSYSNQASDDADAGIQRGIWGGPITPGRFFAAPLGAAPRVPSTYGAGSGPSTSAATRPTVRTTPTPTADSSASASRPTYDRRTSSTNHLSAPGTPQIASGAITPFSSNPPVIFTSTGAARPAVYGSDAKDGEDQVVNDNDARRMAAEAALRRLGLSSSVKPSSSSSSLVRGEADSSESIDLADKGKGKEREGAPSDQPSGGANRVDEWGATPTHVPHLSAVTPSFVSQLGNLLPSSSSRALPANGDRSDTIQRIDDRLKVLRDVDETIWGLVGELTRLKSTWEREGEVVAEPQSASQPGDGSARNDPRRSASEAEDEGVEQLLGDEGSA